jgi:hypothetical protein
MIEPIGSSLALVGAPPTVFPQREIAALAVCRHPVSYTLAMVVTLCIR